MPVERANLRARIAAALERSRGVVQFEAPLTSRRWRSAFISLFLERDLPQLGINAPAPAMRRFWTSAR